MSSKKQVFYVKEYALCDRNHFRIIKGISVLAALAAVFCKTFLQLGNSSPITHMATAVFVLCSGFGLSESFQKKGGLIHYWENKMVKVWLPSVAVVLALSMIEKGNVTSWISKNPVALKGNLLYLIFGGYGVFWLIFRFVESKNGRILGLFLCAAAAFAIIPEDIGIKAHVIAFPVGVLLSQTGWKRTMMKAGWGVKMLVLAACLAAALGGWMLSHILTTPYVHTLLRSVWYLGAALSLILLTYYLQKIPVWGIFVPIGIASYELYLIYDGVFKVFAGKSGPMMYIALFVILFVAAAGLFWLRELLISWNYKMRRKGRTHLKGSMK